MDALDLLKRRRVRLVGVYLILLFASSVVYFAAGSVRANFAKFGVFFLVASFVWTPILVGSTAF